MNIIGDPTTVNYSEFSSFPRGKSTRSLVSSPELIAESTSDARIELRSVFRIKNQPDFPNPLRRIDPNSIQVARAQRFQAGTHDELLAQLRTRSVRLDAERPVPFDTALQVSASQMFTVHPRQEFRNSKIGARPSASYFCAC